MGGRSLASEQAAAQTEAKGPARERMFETAAAKNNRMETETYSHTLKNIPETLRDHDSPSNTELHMEQLCKCPATKRKGVVRLQK